jgi:hypothetical protein
METIVALLDINKKKLQPLIPSNLQDLNIQRLKFFFFWDHFS